jgi:hypothetical protein
VKQHQQQHQGNSISNSISEAASVKTSVKQHQLNSISETNKSHGQSILGLVAKIIILSLAWADMQKLCVVHGKVVQQLMLIHARPHAD